MRVPMVWLQLSWSRQKNPQCISADTPLPLLTLRRDPYEVRLDVALAKSGPVFLSTQPRFAQNPRNAHDETFFHHPAIATETCETGCGPRHVVDHVVNHVVESRASGGVTI